MSIEDVVCTVSLMYIIVEDGDALKVMFELEVSCAHCHVVEHTKTVDFVLGARMVAWRAHNTESIRPFSTHHLVYTL